MRYQNLRFGSVVGSINFRVLLAVLMLPALAAWRLPVGMKRRVISAVGVGASVMLGWGAVAPPSSSYPPFLVASASVATFDVGKGFSFDYPEGDLEPKPKWVQTHGIEVFLKSKRTKNFNVGLTLDRVRVVSVLDFGSVEQLAQRVVDVEKAKEGVFEADVVSRAEAMISAAAGFRVRPRIQYVVAAAPSTSSLRAPSWTTACTS